MGNEQRYRLVGNNHYHDGERLQQGAVFVPTEGELRAFGHKFEPVEEDESNADDGDPVADAVQDGADEALDDIEGALEESVDQGDSDEADVDEESADAEFDAEAFIDDTWQSVTNGIEAGEVDEHLEAVVEAEKARDGGPRDSVKNALDERGKEVA